jgi:hypothetical protein
LIFDPVVVVENWTSDQEPSTPVSGVRWEKLDEPILVLY